MYLKHLATQRMTNMRGLDQKVLGSFSSTISAELITWKDFLLLLEGETVHLPSPKNQFSAFQLTYAYQVIFRFLQQANLK